MAVSVTMPQLGESVTEGTVTRWLKQEGDHVEADEPLLEVSTDKVDTEVPAPASGTLSKIAVQEDETVEVGVELAVIGDGAASDGDGGAASDAAADGGAASDAATDAGDGAAPVATESADPSAAKQAPEPPAPDTAKPAAAQALPASSAVAATEAAPPAPAPRAEPGEPASSPVATETGSAPGAYVTPLVRKLAAEHGVDLAAVQGTGVGGRVRKQDVLDATRTDTGVGAGAGNAAGSDAAEPASAAPRPAAAAPASVAAGAAPAPASGAPTASGAQIRGRTEKLSRLRNVIATRMVESLRTSAQLTTVVEADVTEIARLREQAKAAFEQREGTKLSFLPFFALATVEALKAHPRVNSSIDMDAGAVTYHDAEHLGIAVDTERGLLVPVIHDAGDLNLGGMARKIADLAERTRGNKVSPDELGGGTFTLTNTGSRGALFDTPIINQPQVGIIGTGTVVKRPVVVDDPRLGEVIAVRSVVYLALTYDHRIVDGADAARFLLTVKERLEEGDFAGDLGL